MKRVLRILPCLIVGLYQLGCAAPQVNYVIPNPIDELRIVETRSGREVSRNKMLKACFKSDVVFFGEEHYNALCNDLQRQLLAKLHHANQPALAMEFFERDTQSYLDAYLLGQIDEASFQAATKRGKNYATSHRPLIELCKEHALPGIAANAPRDLVRAYRRSGKSYDDFRAGLPVEQRRWLPATMTQIGGGYEKRFRDAMQHHAAGTPNERLAIAHMARLIDEPPMMEPVAAEPAKGPHGANTAHAMPSVESLYQAQLLWDNSMAETVANFRTRFPERPVMLVVGKFHVQQDGATAAIFRQMRPMDRTVTIIYQTATDDVADEAIDPALGDFVVIGPAAESGGE